MSLAYHVRINRDLVKTSKKWYDRRMFNGGAAVFVDIETNGKMGAAGRIIEIGIIKIENDEIVEEFKSLVNPGAPVPVWIERLTGIKNDELTSAPYFEDLADELHRLMDGAVFVAHNVRFDYSFFKSHFAGLGIDYRPKLFCTVRMSRGLFPEHKGHSLEKIIARHNITVADRHRAFDDAKAMYDFTRLTIAQKGLEAFEQNVAHQLKTKTLPPNLDVEKFAHLPQRPGVYIFEDKDGQPLYVGKSVNIRTRVLSHFANDTKIAKEMRLSQRSFNVSYIETDTEIEALLLESTKIKELHPPFNRLLRRRVNQSVLQKSYDDAGYLRIQIANRDLSKETDLGSIYGVYTSRAKAKNTLESLTRLHQLCPQLMSLEPDKKGACFRCQLGLCKGACAHKEPAELYNARAEQALIKSQLDAWPFKGKIAVTISQQKSLIVDQWAIEGVVQHEFEPVIERLEGGFELDTYKILRSFIRKHPAAVREYQPQTSYSN